MEKILSNSVSSLPLDKSRSQLRSQNEAKHFDELAEVDEVFRGGKGFDYFNHPCQPENHALLNLFPHGFEGKKVLDLGCGLGEAAYAFAGRGAEVMGVDVSTVSLKRAANIAAQDN